MNIPSVLRNVAARPEMYFFGEGYYDCFVAFVAGYDEAKDNRFLTGFRDWLLLVENIEESKVSGMGWERLIITIDCPDIAGNPSVWPLTHEEHLTAIRKAVEPFAL